MLWQGPHAVAGEECEEEGEGEVKCYELTATPIITWNAICSNKDTSLNTAFEEHNYPYLCVQTFISSLNFYRISFKQ